LNYEIDHGRIAYNTYHHSMDPMIFFPWRRNLLIANSFKVCKRKKYPTLALIFANAKKHDPASRLLFLFFKAWARPEAKYNRTESRVNSGSIICYRNPILIFNRLVPYTVLIQLMFWNSHVPGQYGKNRKIVQIRAVRHCTFL
jgi:hypothetical protein